MVQEVNAHGAVGTPIARQYRCNLDGGYWWPEDGSGIPNDGCRAAYLEGLDGNRVFPFTQWNEVSANPRDPGDFDTVKEAVPDGLLCAGGDVRKRGLDVPQDQGWHKTTIVVPEDGQIKLRWENTQAHNPSWMYVFITKESYDPSDPLRWSDLELIYDHPAAAPTPVTPDDSGHLPGTITSFYDLDVDIPRGRAGDAILYSYWQRIDSGNEGFFGCSDVTIVRKRPRVRFQYLIDYFYNT